VSGQFFLGIQNMQGYVRHVSTIQKREYISACQQTYSESPDAPLQIALSASDAKPAFYAVMLYQTLPGGLM